MRYSIAATYAQFFGFGAWRLVPHVVKNCQRDQFQFSDSLNTASQESTDVLGGSVRFRLGNVQRRFIIAQSLYSFRVGRGVCTSAIFPPSTGFNKVGQFDIRHLPTQLTSPVAHPQSLSPLKLVGAVGGVVWLKVNAFRNCISACPTSSSSVAGAHHVCASPRCRENLVNPSLPCSQSFYAIPQRSDKILDAVLNFLRQCVTVVGRIKLGRIVQEHFSQIPTFLIVAHNFSLSPLRRMTGHYFVHQSVRRDSRLFNTVSISIFRILLRS